MTDNRVMGHIDLDQIRPNPIALRSVEKDSETFASMVDSIRGEGKVINPISVTKKEEDGESYYELVDGLHRYTASIEAGKSTIPAIVLDESETDVHILQIIGNIHKVETKPYQYANQLKLILSSRPEMSLSELAKMVAYGTDWVKARLKLLSLSGELGALVDNGTICLSNAYELSKLPEEEQEAYSAQAQTLEPKEFLDIVAARVKEINAAKRKGEKPGEAVFEPKAKCRKVGDLKAEFEAGMPTLKTLVAGQDAEGAMTATMEWVLSLDAKSLETSRADFDQRKAERDEKAKAREQDRAAKALAKAAEANAAVNA